MNNLSRRDLIALLAGSTALTTCANFAAIDAQILADVQGLTPAIASMVTRINSMDPGVISANTMGIVTTLEGAAEAALSSISSVTPAPTGASKVQIIDAYLNAGLEAVGAALPVAAIAFPVLLPMVPMYDAAVAMVIGVIEPFINTFFAKPIVHSALPLLVPSVRFSPAEARSIFNIPNMHTKWSS
jgi:hypothetical protein